MRDDRYIPANGGVAFKDGADWGRILVPGHATDGRYSLMEFVVSPRALARPGQRPDFAPHRHNEIEETFLVKSGRLKFLLGQQVIDLGPGDFVRVPPGGRHGFSNVSHEPVELLISFHPGGFEQLFLRYRSDQQPPPSELGFVEDAVRQFNSAFEDFPHIR
jgi:mannose-6-phosphate isomerase-like protein (cupin superfamily)